MKVRTLNMSGISRNLFAKLIKKHKTELQYVAGVSWPRSGHHLVGRVLRKYFGKRKFFYCEYYSPEDCCKKFPCARAGQVHFSKNHDHDFEVPQMDDLKYFIQYRDFSYAVVSNFELLLKRGAGPDTATEFQRFASREWSDHRTFIEKWVTSDFAKSQLVMDYAELTGDPIKAMQKIILLFAPNSTVNHAKLVKILGSIPGISHNSSGAVVTGTGVKARRRLQDFRFYDPHIFSLLKRLKLDREEVIETYREIHGCEPEEAKILEYQSSSSPGELMLRLRDE